ncbi:MAG: hypothetical protein R3C68_01125 [Myxococcota bacterium]
MVKAGNVDGPSVKAQQGTTLQQKEAEQVKSQNQQRVSSQDAARLASQAGFQRLRKKSGKGFDVGDSSHSPIPIPDDELDSGVWSQDRLDDARGNMTLASAQFGEIAKGTEGTTPLGEVVVGSSFMPIEDDIADMQAIADRESQEAMPALQEVSHDVDKLFGIRLHENIPVGHRVLAAGLVVAGEPESVKVKDDGLEEKELASGLEKVTKRGNQSVSEAQKMSKGINREINFQRTRMFKR